MKHKCEKYGNEIEAMDAAKKMIETEKYSCVILSKGIYFVENDIPFIRNYETLIAEFERGKNGVAESSNN